MIRGNVWYLNNGLDGAAEITVTYGSSSDFPVVGDWDGNGTQTPGVVRGNKWFLNNAFDSSGDVPVFAFGLPSDRKIVGDWDGSVG